MLYAVFSDIHANLEALEVVLEDAARHTPDAYVCLGDLVGYGPDPNACVARIRGLGGPIVAGNHDRAAAGALDPGAFTPLAQASTVWTAEAIDTGVREFLAALPERHETPAFLAVHGSPRDPIEEYILTLPTALAVFSESRFSLCLVGHTHVPGIFTLSPEGKIGARSLPEGKPVGLTTTSRYIVNAGSVGQPRDGDPRAAYLLLDDEVRSARLRRLPYPVAATQAKMAARGLPAPLAERLAIGT